MSIFESPKPDTISTKRTSANNRPTAFALGCFFFLLLSALILMDGLLSLGRIHAGVEISGVGIGGLTPTQASEKIQSGLQDSVNKPVKITYQENHWQVTPDHFNTKISIPKSVNEAYAVGREGGFVQVMQQRISCWTSHKKLSLVYSADYRLMTSFIDDIAKTIDKKPIDAGIEIKNEQPKITPSQSGIQLNQAELFSSIRTRLVSLGNRTVEAPVAISPVKVTEENAREALSDTKEMMRSALTVTYNERSWNIAPNEIGNLVAFKKVKTKKSKRIFKLKAELHPEKVKNHLSALTKDVNIEPQNAEFRVDGKNVTITPSKTGVVIDTADAFLKMKKVLFSNMLRQITLVTKVAEPERTTQEAEAMGIKERVSVFSTSFSSGNTPRVNNINLLARDLDGTIVAPGKVFSFNETIGPRTAEKGYKEAPAIVQGELVPSIGGGVCQVATTLFNTVFFAGYPIVSRQNHSFYISHYPAGRDATVAWGGPDFKFKNDTDAYLLIKTWPSSSSITVAIYSTNYNTEVTHKAMDFSNFTPFNTKYVNDPALPKDQQVTEAEGLEGRDITVFRTVKRGGKFIREDKFFSRYKPKQATVRVGTMEAAPPPQPTPSETQTAN